MDEKCPVILPKCRFTLYIEGSFTCRKATTWDRRLYFPSEGRRAEVFFALKIQRFRQGANPRTWVPKASTLPLDHRSRFSSVYSTLNLFVHLFHGHTMYVLQLTSPIPSLLSQSSSHISTATFVPTKCYVIFAVFPVTCFKYWLNISTQI